jgi:hypothetical protein
MEAATIIQLLAQGLPLARKLEAQQFAYECTEEDITLVLLLDEVEQAVNAWTELTAERFREMVQQAGLTQGQMAWLLCLQQTGSQRLQQRLRKASKPYQPLAERLRAIQQEVTMSQAQGILLYKDDPGICRLPERAKMGPIALIEAERRWEEFNQGFDGLDYVDGNEPVVGFPKEEQHKRPSKHKNRKNRRKRDHGAYN